MEDENMLRDDELEQVAGGARVLISQSTYNGSRSTYIACDLAPDETTLAQRANYFWRNGSSYDNDCPDFDARSEEYYQIPGCRNCQFCNHFRQYETRA